MFPSRRARRWIALALVLAATLVPSSLASSSSPPSGSASASASASASRRLLGRQSRWRHAMFEEIRGEVRRSAHSFLHDRTDRPLRLPLEVNVVLVGFDGEGGFRHRVDERALADFLRDSFGRYRPSCLETGEQLEVEVELRYNVLHAGGDALARLERAARSEMTRVADEPPPREWNDAGSNPAGGIPARERWRAYDVEASGAVERAVRATYVELFAPAEPVAVFVVNPDKRRMDPSLDPAAAAAAAAASGTTRGEDMSPAELEREESGYVYRYRYMGSEGRTSAWLSADRFAVLDLAAGPCALARVGAPIGSDAARLTTAWSLPRLAPLLLPHARAKTPAKTPAAAAAAAAARDAQFRARMSAIALSAVRHVVAPDVGAETLDFSRRVMLPIIALRDHDLFAPLSPASGARGVDVDLVFSEARRLLQPGQILVSASGTHNLHEHEHLAAAVLRARRAVTTAGPGSGFGDATRTVTREYLDSETLLEEFRGSADLLASGLTDLGEDASVDDAFVRQRGMPNPRATGGTVKRDGDGGGGRERVERDGTRVIPVYVLSLAGLPPGTLVDGESLVAAAEDLVVVVQPVGDPAIAAPGADDPNAWGRGKAARASAAAAELARAAAKAEKEAEKEATADATSTSNAGRKAESFAAAARVAASRVAASGAGDGEWVPLRFLSDDRVVRARPSEPTRHVVAGVARALGGVAAPHERHSVAHGHRVENWLWSVGHHPFGPFTNCSTLSAALADVARRNAVLSRADTALRAVRGGLAATERFADAFLKPPLADVFPFPRERRAASPDDVAPSAGTRDGPREPEQTWLDYLYADPDRAGVPGPLPQTVVAEMERDVERLEDAFVRLGDALYGGDLDAAHELSSQVLDAARAFEAYVAREVRAARDALGCCRTARRRRDGGNAAAAASVVLVAAGGAYLLLVVGRGARARGGASGRGLGFGFSLGGGAMRGSALRRRAHTAARARGGGFGFGAKRRAD